MTRNASHRSIAFSAGLLTLVAGASAQISFFAAVSYSTAQRPSGVAAADFNGDGWTDLAVSLGVPDRIGIMFGNGDGTFNTPVSVPLGAGVGAGSVVAADLNGDGTTDLAVALQNSNQVRLLSNDGTGTFTAASTIAVGSNPRGMRAAHLNGDNQPDLVVANRDSDNFTVMLNAGGFSFTPATYPAGAEPRDVAAGDINGNGFLDLVVTNHDDRTISVLHNSGTGTFTLAQTLSVGGGTRPAGVTAGDFDGDGAIDFAVATDFLAIFRNVGGSLTGPTNYPVGGLEPDPIIAVDLDSDGDLDVVIGNEDSNNISVLANNGGAFSLVQTYSTGLRPGGLAAGRFDANSSPDLAVTNRDDHTTSVLLNQDTGPVACYPNCDGSTVEPILNVDDFTCFVNEFALAQTLPPAQQVNHYVNCDNSTVVPVLNVDDFTCFINSFAFGCR